MRRYGIQQAYEQVKKLTRNKKISKNQLIVFIEQLSIPSEAKNRLKSLIPSSYTGFAAELAKKISTFKWD